MQANQAIEQGFFGTGSLGGFRGWRCWIAVALAGALLAACAPARQEVPIRRSTTTTTPQQTRPQTGNPANIDPSALGGAAPARVALLIPLSGEHEFIGQAMQRAAEMAVFETGGQNFNLIPIDTRGTAEGARSAANQAISQGAEIILGPVFAHSANAVRMQTQAANIPVIAFSTDPSVAGGNVYLLSFLARPQVHRILGFASQQGLTRVAVLAPDNDYGRTVARYAQEATARLNISVTRIGFYDPSGENLNEAIQGFTGTVRMSRSGRGRTLRAVRSEPLNFDAILLPDGGRRLRSVASLLAYYDVNPKNIRYLGTGLWDSETVLEERQLRGGWFAGPPPGARDRFITKYRQAYQDDPPRIASLAYDGVALAAELARSGPEGQRFTRQAITNPSGFLGIDGVFRFGEDGLSDRGLAVMQVTAEEFRLIDPAPQTFEPGIN